jgi:hypothetical protein
MAAFLAPRAGGRAALRALLTACLLLAAACDLQPELRDGDHGLLTLSFDDAAGRAITSGKDLPADVLASFRYEVIFSGPEGETLNHSVSAEGSLSLTLALGNWRIDAAAYQGQILTGTGSLAFTLAAGENRVRVPMRLQGGYFDIGISATTGGSVTSAFSAAFPGTPVTLTAAPAAGYRLLSMSAGGGVSLGGSGNSRTFTMPAADVTVSAEFEAAYAIHIPAMSGGTVTANPAAAFAGNTVTLTVSPDAGWQLRAGSLKANGGELTLTAIGGGVYTFTMPQAAVTLSAEFIGGELVSIAGVNAYLANAAGGDTAANPLPLQVSIALDDGGWANLLAAIAGAGKYVALDLSGSTLAGTEFDPRAGSVGGKERIVSFTLPDAAETLTYDLISPAFENFSALAAVSGENITDTGSFTFRDNTALKTISFPNATGIGIYSFYGCTALKTVSLPNATDIGSYAFSGCTALKTISLTYATVINDDAFYGCTALKTIDLPDATNIGSYAFSYCTALETVSLPNATSIGEYAFWICTALETIDKLDLPNVTSIGNNAFQGCASLRVVYLEKVTNADNSYQVFKGCTILEEAYLPRIINIGSASFEGCTNLTIIAIGENCSGTSGIPNGFVTCYNSQSNAAGIYKYSNVLYGVWQWDRYGSYWDDDEPPQQD